MNKYKDMTYTIRTDDKRCVKKIILDNKNHFISAKNPQLLYIKYQDLIRKYHREELNISDIKIEEWSYKWLKTYKKTNEKKTQKFYLDIIKLHIVPNIRTY